MWSCGLHPFSSRRPSRACKASSRLMILLTLAAFPAAIFATGECIISTGIDASCDGDSVTCVPPANFSSVPRRNSLSMAINKLLEPKPGFLAAEAPVQAHWMSIVALPTYAVAAAFHPTAYEMFGRPKSSNMRRRCDAATSGLSAQQFWLYRRVAIAYSLLWGIAEGVVYTNPEGGAEASMRELAAEWGIEFDICDRLTNCDDISTPWGLARSLVNEALVFTDSDGWNWNGVMGKRHNNLIPYRDYRESPYVPQNDPWTLTVPEKWQPLLENSGDGFLSRQVFVTPHIGDTAYSFYLGNDEICRRTGLLQDPNYDLEAEALLVLERTRVLDETTKAEIEFFDSKFESLLQTLLFQLIDKMTSRTQNFEGIQMFAATVTAIREAMIVVWKAKVDFDLVRPTSFIHKTFKEDLVNSYGGPDIMGPDELLGRDWQSYIRTMPHAEFPSGSACVCTAFAEVVVALTGSDNFSDLIGEPLVRTAEAGSSKVEEGKPESAIQFEYDSWSTIVERCSQTRLEGGMHFTQSIAAGAELCAGIGDIVATSFKELENGKAPSSNKPKYRQRRAEIPDQRC